MTAYIPSVLFESVPAATIRVGSYIVDREGLVFRVNAVRRERGNVVCSLDRDPMLIISPRETRPVRPTTKVRTLSPEGEAVHEGREFSWLPGYAP